MAIQNGLPAPVDPRDPNKTLNLERVCLECGQEMDDATTAVPVPGYPDRYAHPSCRATVLSVAFQAVGL